MSRKTLICSLPFVIALAALPASAQNIPPGEDLWRTPADTGTYYTFPNGDVESLCGAPASTTWNHRVVFIGAPYLNDVDTSVARLDNAVFNSNGIASTRVQFRRLSLKGAQTSTPCGLLTFQALLASDRPQPITTMTIQRTAASGGVFFAKLALRLEIRAFVASGAYLGSLFYDLTLDDVAGGTPWSYGGPIGWRAGMTAANNCIDVLRKKLAATPTDSKHHYFISDMIAAGRCYPQG